MPSSSTTNVTLSTILDLIGAGTSSQPVSKGQLAFDSLLQPAAPATAISLVVAPATDDRRADSSSTEPSGATCESKSPPADEHVVSDDAHHQPDPSPAPSTATGADERKLPTKANDSNSGEPHDAHSHAGEEAEAIAESLAAVSAVAPLAAASIQPAATPTASEAKEPRSEEPALAAGKLKDAKAGVAAVQGAGPAVAPATVEQTKPEQPTPLATAAASKSSAPPGTNQGKDFGAAKHDLAIPSNGEKSNSEQTAEIAQAQQANDDSEPTLELPHDQRQETVATAQTNAPTVDPSVALAHAVDALAAANPTVVPSVAGPTGQQPIVDAGSSSSSSAGPPNSIAGAAPQARARLPAEVFAQSTTASNRRTPVDVDTTRLLTRIARAFSTAQERDGEIRLRLSPPELGSLRLEVRVQDGALVARLQTETDAARTAILDNLPALRDRLSEQGVRIERFDVDLMQRQPGGMPDQPGGRQSDLPAGTVRVAPSSRPRVEPAATLAPALPQPNSSDGLNVIV